MAYNSNSHNPNEFVRVAIYEDKIFAALPFNIPNIKELFNEEWAKHPKYKTPISDTSMWFKIGLKTRVKVEKLGFNIPTIE